MMSETVTSRSPKLEFDPVSQQSLVKPPVAFLQEFCNWGTNLCPVFFVNS
jgi:hypothetical protein